MEEEVSALGADAVAEKAMTVFPRMEDGTPFLYDYQIKGFFKDTCGGLRKVKGTASEKIKAYKKEIDKLIFPEPRVIPLEFDGPIALRYPRGEAYDGLREFRHSIVYGKSEILYEEEDIALLAVGSMVKTAEAVRHRLKEIGYSCTLVNARFVKPIDTDVVKELAKDHRLIVTMEENVRSGGYGEKVRDYVQEQEIPVHVLTIALPDEYVEHGNVALLYEEVGIDAESVTKRIIEKYVTCPKEDGRR